MAERPSELIQDVAAHLLRKEAFVNLWQIRNEAYELFMKGNLVDLENWRGNTPEGIHTAPCSVRASGLSKDSTSLQ